MKQRFSQHMRYYERSLILILMLFSASVMQAQSRTVKGTVSDAQGEPIIGANVVIVGGTKGVITDLDGKYSIQVPENGAVLKFSYIGLNKIIQCSKRKECIKRDLGRRCCDAGTDSGNSDGLTPR